MSIKQYSDRHKSGTICQFTYLRWRPGNVCILHTLYIADVFFNCMHDSASCQDFFDRGLLLTRKLLNEGFLLIKLQSSLRKFYGRHHDLVNRYETSVSHK